jgi:drug/metabolite transporter (DMT)-like permease
LGAAVPLATTLAARLFIREPLSRIKLAGITVGLAGALLIILVPILEKGQAIGTNITGNLLLIGSVIAWTLYIVRSRSSLINGTYTPVVSIFVNFATCTVAAAGAAIITHQSFIVPAFGQLSYVSIFLYAVLGLTITTFFLFQWAVQHVSATTASLKEYIQLVEGVALNTIILGERITPIFFLGSILVISGVVIATGQHISRRLMALIESRNP